MSTELQALLEKQWTRRNGEPDEKMVKYCLKSSKYIDLGEYYLSVGDSKPSIDSDMWYDDETTGPDSSKFEAFREYNIKGKAHRFESLAEDNRTKFWTYTKWNGDKINGKIRGWTVTREWETPSHLANADLKEATADDIAAIKQGMNEINADFEKRLKTYWKRYSDKVSARGYWANR